MNIQSLERPLVRVILWCTILNLIINFWPHQEPRSVWEDPEVITVYRTVYVQVPKENIVVQEPIVEIIPPIPPKYGFTDDDIYLMTVLLCGSKDVNGDGEYDIDFGNQDNEEQISLVLNIVMNRVMSNKFPDTVSEVIWAKNQFHPMARWSKNNLPEVSSESYEIVKAWCESYDLDDSSVMTIPKSHLYFAGNGVVNRSRANW